MPTRGGAIAMVGALAFAGCSALTSGVLDDKDPTPTPGTGGAGEGGMVPVVPCLNADECPGVDTTCRYRTCEGGACDFENAPTGVGCSDNDGLFCNGDGACVQCLDDEDCTGTDSCLTGICAPVHCTDGERNEGETDEDCGGPCPPCGNGKECDDADDCTSAFCDDGTCAACGNDADCDDTPGTYCDGGACVPQKVEGDQCFADTECVSGVCADQVCCDRDCVDCEGCRVGLTGIPNGTCGSITAGSDPHDHCPAESIMACGTTGECDGNGACEYPIGAVCSTASCTGGIESYDGTCTGPDACSAAAPASCGPYACATDACHASCTSNAQCSSGYACVQSQCRTCGMSPGPSGPCPAICTGGCGGGTCTIVCDGGASGPCDGGVTCPPGYSCLVDCKDAQSCMNDTITCPPDGHACIVECNANLSCQNSTITCGAGPCTLDCGGGDGCSGTSFACGNNSCDALCNGQNPNVTNTSGSCMYSPSGC